VLTFTAKKSKKYTKGKTYTTGLVTGAVPGKVEIEKDLIKIEKRTRVENVREYTPNVIEPSFGNIQKGRLTPRVSSPARYQ
jgi:glycyl-tRNA synthetase (class II)